MIALALGLLLVGGTVWAARSFSRASVANVRALLAWVVAIAGLLLAAMLFLTGRGAVAMSALVLLGPLAWSFFQEGRGRRTAASPPGSRSEPRLGRVEALDVLGLREGASEAEIRAAWKRLMRAAHPDNGGSDWLAARINAAKDALLPRG